LAKSNGLRLPRKGKFNVLPTFLPALLPVAVRKYEKKLKVTSRGTQKTDPNYPKLNPHIHLHISRL